MQKADLENSRFLSTTIANALARCIAQLMVTTLFSPSFAVNEI